MSSCKSYHVQKLSNRSHMSLLTVHLSAFILRVAAAPLTLVIFSCRFLKRKMTKMTKNQRKKVQMIRQKMIKNKKTSSST